MIHVYTDTPVKKYPPVYRCILDRSLLEKSDLDGHHFPTVIDVSDDGRPVIKSLEYHPQRYIETQNDTVTISPAGYYLYLVFDICNQVRPECYSGKCILRETDTLAILYIASEPDSKYMPENCVVRIMDMMHPLEHYIRTCDQDVYGFVDYEKQLEDPTKYGITAGMIEMLSPLYLEGGYNMIRTRTMTDDAFIVKDEKKYIEGIYRKFNYHS